MPLFVQSQTRKRLKKVVFKPKARRALTSSQVRAVKRVVQSQQEHKYKEGETSTASVLNTHAPISMTSGIAQGSTANERDGLVILPTSLSVHYNSQPNTTVPGDSHIRFIIFQWFDDTTPAANTVLDHFAGGFATLSHYNIDTQKGKFKVLYDRMFSQVDGVSNSFLIGRALIKKGLSKIYYPSGATVEAQRGSIWYQVITDRTANGPEWDIRWRLRFTDS